MNDDHVKTIVELRAEIERLRALRSNALTGELSDSKIAKLTKHWTRDCDNLYIQVQHPGSRRRSWLFRWRDRVTREYRSIGLGPYPTISIDQARELALYYRQLLLDGQDPRAVRDSKKLDMLIARKLVKTVREVAMEWFEQRIARKSLPYRTKILNQLHKYVYPTIGDMPIQKVDTNTIVSGQPGVENSKTVGLRDLLTWTWPTGKDVQQYLERIFAYAIKQKYFRGENPAAWSIIQDLVPDRDDVYERKNRDWLLYKDLTRFLQKLRAYEDRSVRKIGHPTIADALEVVALTGVRVNEVLLMQWREIQGNTWNVPPEHRKKSGKRKRGIRPIPITKSMQAVFDRRQAQRTDQSDDALVFPSDKNGGKISVGSLVTFIRKSLKWEYKIDPHGFRSTLRDWKDNETNFDDILWKRQVDHSRGFAPGAGNHLLQMADTTDLSYGHDPLLERRRVMMEQYDDFGTPPLKSDKVVKLSGKRRTA
jgi:integrase